MVMHKMVGLRMGFLQRRISVKLFRVKDLSRVPDINRREYMVPNYDVRLLERAGLM